jgi:hypothetical protein
VTRASPGRRERRRQRGAPKKKFATDPDRGTIDVAEVLHLIGFNRDEAYDLAATVREGQLVGQKAGPKQLALSFELPVTVPGRTSALRQKADRESAPIDSLRRDLLAARLIIARRATSQEAAVRALDSLLTLASVGEIKKLHQAVRAMARQFGNTRRQRRAAKKSH